MVEIERGLVDSGLRGRGGVDPPKPRTVRGSGSTPGGALGVANPIDGQSGPLGVRSQQSSPSHRKEITCSRHIFGPPKGRFPGLGHNSGLRGYRDFAARSEACCRWPRAADPRCIISDKPPTFRLRPQMSGTSARPGTRPSATTARLRSSVGWLSLNPHPPNRRQAKAWRSHEEAWCWFSAHQPFSPLGGGA